MVSTCFSAGTWSIWRVPTGGGTEEEVIAPDHDARWNGFQTAATGLYYLELDHEERTVALLRFYDFQSKKSRELVQSASRGPLLRFLFLGFPGRPVRPVFNRRSRSNGSRADRELPLTNGALRSPGEDTNLPTVAGLSQQNRDLHFFKVISLSSRGNVSTTMSL